MKHPIKSAFSVSRAFQFLAVILLFTAVSYAQSTFGTIAGSIVDPSGAALEGASITVTSLQTGDVRTGTTNKVGGYRIESLLPGTYRVEVDANGFQKTTANNAVVNASVITSVNVALKVGPAVTSLEVSADSVSALKTDSGELSDTISQAEINNLPIATLNPYSLADTLPGVTVVTSQLTQYSNGFAFSVNGNRSRDNNFLVEGEDNNDQGIHGQAFQPENDEAIDQVTFLLSSFTAEYGRGGAVSNLLFKGGSNSFHGAAYERLLNSALDGKDKGDVLNQSPKEKSRQNLFGFRIGGPIIKDHLFFFVSNQWDRFRATSNLGVLTVPTAAGFATLQNYSTLPQVAALLQAFGSLRGTNPLYATTVSLGNDPVTGTPRGTVAFAGVQRSLGNTSNGRELEATSDWIASQKDKVRFRFIQSPQTDPIAVANFPNQLPGFDGAESGTTYNAGIIHTHIFSDTVLNELRPAWSRIGFGFTLTPSTAANPLASLPSITLTGISSNGIQVGYGIPSGVPQGRFQDTYQLEDAVTWTRGAHTMKFGIDIEDQRIKDETGSFFGSISYGSSKAVAAVPPSGSNPGSPAIAPYTSLGNFLDNYSGSSALATITYGNPTARPQIWVQNYYAEDSWKVARNFEFDFGLRYEYDGTPFNFLPNPAFNPANPSAFPGGVPQLPNTKNLAPRAGFNYSINDKTVISGGAGVFYSHVFTNIIDNIQGSSPNAASKQINSSSTGRGNTNWSGIFNTITNKNPLATDVSNVITQHFLDPETFQYNLRIQRELPAAMVLAVQYVGNRNEHQYATTEFNPFLNNVWSTGGSRLFPSRGRIILQDNTEDSNYNGAQVELLHKMGSGLTFRGVYTFSKLLDTGSEIFTPIDNANLSRFAEKQYPNSRAREYGPSGFDHRHRLVVSAVYAPPAWHAAGGEKVFAAVVNGWTFSGITSFQSGQPINVEIGGTVADWNGDGIANDRPILLNKNAPITNWAIKGDDPVFGFGLAPGTLCDGPAWYATNDDCHPVTQANTHWVTSFGDTTQNTVGRNSLTADHQSNTDLTVERSFHTFEHQDFMIRVEAFDVFNHGSTGDYNATLTTGVPYNGKDQLGNVYSGNVTFANKALTVNGSRSLRFYARYQFCHKPIESAGF